MIKPITYKILFAIIILKNQEIKQIDIKTIFFYNKFNDIVYINILIRFKKLNNISKLY